MNQSFRIPARNHVGLGLALVLSVALVTLLFNFLGTLSCCVLVAMMSGAAKQWRWQILLVSLVFPAVLMSFAPIPQVGLPLRESLLLSALCFGVFWLTYLLTCALICLERPSGQAAPGKRQPPAQSTYAGVPAPVMDSPVSVPTGRSCESEIEELQGTWSVQAAAAEGQSCRQVIEVTHDQLTLRITDGSGKVRVLSQGSVRLERSGSLKILKVVAAAGAPGVASAEQGGALATWVYQLAGQTLKVAVNFDATGVGQEPAIETYVKTRGPAGAQLPDSPCR